MKRRKRLSKAAAAGQSGAVAQAIKVAELKLLVLDFALRVIHLF